MWIQQLCILILIKCTQFYHASSFKIQNDDVKCDFSIGAMFAGATSVTTSVTTLVTTWKHFSNYLWLIFHPFQDSVKLI